MDPIVEQLLATTGLSCEDLLAKLQQYTQKVKPSQEEDTVPDSDSSTKLTSEHSEQCTSRDKSVIFETNSSTVASSETSDIKITTETEHKNDASCSTQAKSEETNEDCCNTETERGNINCSRSPIESENDNEDCCSRKATVEHDTEDLCNIPIRTEHNGEDSSAVLSSEEKHEHAEKTIDQQSAPESSINDSYKNVSSEEMNPNVLQNETVKPNYGKNITNHNTHISSHEEVCTNDVELPSCSQRETNKDVCKNNNNLLTSINTFTKEDNVRSQEELGSKMKKKKVVLISSIIISNVTKDCHQTQERKVQTKEDSNDELEQNIYDNINADSKDISHNKIHETSKEENDKSDHDYSNKVVTEKEQNCKLSNDETPKTPNISMSDSIDDISAIPDKLPNSEENLRDVLRKQISSLRNMKKSSGNLTDLKKTSVSFQNLKKKRKSCEINPLTPVDTDSKEEDETGSERTIDETKSMLSSNENSLVSLSEETDFMIVNVTGGVDQLQSNSELENEGTREFAALTETNGDVLSNDKVIDTHENIATDLTLYDKKCEYSIRDANVASTSTIFETEGVVRIHKKKLLSRYDTASKRIEREPLNISVNKNIGANFSHDPGVSKSTKNSEKSPFVSDSLDDFLNESALRVSYPIPKLGAEEGISEKPKPSPFDDIVNKTPKIEQQSVPKEPKLLKAKTLAEMRRQYEKMNATGKVTEDQPIENLSRYKRNKLLKLEKEAAYKKQKLAHDGDPGKIIPSIPPKNSFVMYDNKKLRVFSKNKDKCVAVIHSKSNKENIRELPPTSPLCKQDLTPTRRLSLLSSLAQNKPCIVKYKPGPLCKKITLQNTESRDLWTAELKTLPKIYLEVVPEVHKSIDPKLLHLLPIFDDTVISEERTKFTLSVLRPKDSTSEPESFSFHIPYNNNQESLLVRKPCEPVIRTEETKKQETDPETEIKKILDDLITYVEIKEIGNSIIKDDDLIVEPSQTSIEYSPKCKARKVKRKKLDLELLRLNCKVIDVATNESEDVDCTKAQCRLGCVCKSLLCENIFSNHCQLVDCMFGCECPLSKSCEVNTTNNSLSVHTVNHLEDKAKKNLARVEREFTQTLIHTDNDAILIGTTKMRRSTKPPKKYTDFVGDDDDHGVFEDMPLKKLNLKPKKFDLAVPKLDLDDLIPFCLFHNLYSCHCKGTVNDFPAKKSKDVPQIPKIRIVKTKEDQHKAWYDSCARIRKVFPEYKERNKNPVYNQKLRKTFYTGRKLFKKKPISSEEDTETYITISGGKSGAVGTTKPNNKRKQSFVIREDVSPKFTCVKKPVKEFALQRRKKKIKPNINYKSFNSSVPSSSVDSSVSTDIDVSSPPLEVVDLPAYNPVFEGEIKYPIKDSQELSSLVGNEKEYLRILPWNKLIQDYKSGKISIWAKETGPTTTVLCNAAGHLPPKHFSDIKNTKQKTELIEWILTENLPEISRDLMHLILTPKNGHFLINGYCLKKISDESQEESDIPSNVNVERDADQRKPHSVSINSPSCSSTAQSKSSEAARNMYKFPTRRVLPSTSRIQRIDPEIVKSTLKAAELKSKKKLERQSQSVAARSASLLTNQRSSSCGKRDQNMQQLSSVSEPDASTPTLQQVLNSHKLELTRFSLKRKSSILIAEDIKLSNGRFLPETPFPAKISNTISSEALSPTKISPSISSETPSRTTISKTIFSEAFPTKISQMIPSDTSLTKISKIIISETPPTQTPKTIPAETPPTKISKIIISEAAPTKASKRIPSETSFLSKVSQESVSGIELLQLLENTSKKCKERHLGSEENNITEVEQDPLDITAMQILEEAKRCKQLARKVEENKSKAEPRDPLDLSESSSPAATTSKSSKNSRDPLETSKEPAGNNSSDECVSVGLTENNFTSSIRDPLEITTEKITIEKLPLKSAPLKLSLQQIELADKKIPPKNRQIGQGGLIASRNLKCTHKDMTNKSKTLMLSNKIFTKRKLIIYQEKSPEITVPLPIIAKHLRWRMIYLNSDFTFLTFTKSNYSIKYTDLLDVVKMSGNIKYTITLRNKEFCNDYKHPLFGIFCVPNYQDRLFFGPYFPTEKHYIETLRYLQGRLIDTEIFDRMVGKRISDKSPLWVYESATKSVLPNGLVIDITEDDEGKDIPIVNLDSDSSEETQNIRLQSSDNNLLCPPFVEEISSEDSGVHNVNRYIVTNIPHLGYISACQRESKEIDVFWPGTNKGYRFPNVTFAKNLLTQYLTQIFCPIPRDFQIIVLILTNLAQSNRRIDPKYFSNSGLYFCGEFGIYEKDALPEELLKKYNVESVDKLLKLHQEAQEEDDSIIRLFGMFLMSNEELRKHSEPKSILKWATTEIFLLQRLIANYASEKTDLQNIGREMCAKIAKKRKGITQSGNIQNRKRLRIESTPTLDAEINLTETIEINDSDEEAETTNPVFKKISCSGKVGADGVYSNNDGRSILKSSLWIQKGRSVLKTNSITGQILKGSPENSAVVQPVKISINNSNIVLNKNKMLITKLK